MTEIEKFKKEFFNTTITENVTVDQCVQFIMNQNQKNEINYQLPPDSPLKKLEMMFCMTSFFYKFYSYVKINISNLRIMLLLREITKETIQNHIRNVIRMIDNSQTANEQEKNQNKNILDKLYSDSSHCLKIAMCILYPYLVKKIDPIELITGSRLNNSIQLEIRNESTFKIIYYLLFFCFRIDLRNQQENLTQLIKKLEYQVNGNNQINLRIRTLRDWIDFVRDRIGNFELGRILSPYEDMKLDFWNDDIN
ncbi:hypothetical protein ABPG72_015455 [Tetrahymena utriculariae]